MAGSKFGERNFPKVTEWPAEGMAGGKSQCNGGLIVSENMCMRDGRRER